MFFYFYFLCQKEDLRNEVVQTDQITKTVFVLIVYTNNIFNLFKKFNLFITFNQSKKVWSIDGTLFCYILFSVICEDMLLCNEEQSKIITTGSCVWFIDFFLHQYLLLSKSFNFIHWVLACYNYNSQWHWWGQFNLRKQCKRDKFFVYQI